MILAASGNIFTVVQMFNGKSKSIKLFYFPLINPFPLVAGHDGLMPHIFSMKHYQSRVPTIAIIFEILLSFLFLFFMSNIGQLIICVGMINWICESN